MGTSTDLESEKRNDTESLLSPIVIALLAMIGAMTACTVALLCCLRRTNRERKDRNVADVNESSQELVKVASTSTTQQPTLHGVVASSSFVVGTGTTVDGYAC